MRLNREANLQAHRARVEWRMVSDLRRHAAGAIGADAA